MNLIKQCLTDNMKSAMSAELHPQYITNEVGKRLSVVLPVEEFTHLLEDLVDLKVVAERSNEPTITHDMLIKELKADGLL